MYARDDYKRCVCRYWADGANTCKTADKKDVVVVQKEEEKVEEKKEEEKKVEEQKVEEKKDEVKVDGGLLANLLAGLNDLEAKRDEVDKTEQELKGYLNQVQGVVKKE